MKPEKLLLCIALTFVATFTVNVTKAQKDKAENLKNYMENGNFFVKKTGPDKIEVEKTDVYESKEGVKTILNEKNAVIKYIERLTEDKISPFAQSVVKNCSGKNYLHWEVRDDSKDGIFVIERSENGSDFKTVGFKNRIGTAVPRLSYYYEDKAGGAVFYRILAIGEDGSYKYSDILKVENVTSSAQAVYY